MKKLILLSAFLFSGRSLFADAVVSDFSDNGFRTAASAGGTITFAADGVILLNSPLTISKETMIDATGHNVTVNGNGLTRLFEVSDGVNATFRGLKLINGMDHPAQASAGGGLPAHGGAVLFNSGQLRIESCFLSNNVALGGMGSSLPGSPHGSAYGGAVYAFSGFLRIVDSTFINNRAVGFDRAGESGFAATGGSGYGGALAVEEGDNVDVENSRFTENRAIGGAGVGGGAGGVAYGGALYLPIVGANFTQVEFTGNNAQGGESSSGGTGMGQGGAIWRGSSGVVYADSLIVSSNSATAASALAAGGGIYNRGTLYMNRSSVARNFAKGGKGRIIQNSSGAGYDALGGGLFTAGAGGFTNVTFMINAAYAGDAADPVQGTQGSSGSAYGGGVYNVGSAFLDFVTMALNQVVPGQRSFGAAGVLKGGDLYTSVGANTAAQDSIFASNLSKSISGNLTDGGYNIAIDDSAGFTQSTSFNSRDPVLGPARATYIPLGAGSPAIDSADFISPFWDQLALPRPAGVRPDRGAIEYREIRMGPISLESASVRVRVTNNSGLSYRLEHSIDLKTWTDAGHGGDGSRVSDEFLIPRSSQPGVPEFWRAVFVLPL